MTDQELIDHYEGLKHSILHSTPYSQLTEGERRMEQIALQLQDRGILVPTRPIYEQVVS